MKRTTELEEVTEKKKKKKKHFFIPDCPWGGKKKKKKKEEIWVYLCAYCYILLRFGTTKNVAGACMFNF